MNSQKAIAQLKALQRLVKGKEPRLAAEQEKKWQILISTILASQSRDTLTNKISEILYKKYKSPKMLADAKLSDIKKIIYSINYYKTKAKHIKETAKIISKSPIPDNVEGLIELPGVGRKVANVYLAEAHHAAAIGVDTHVTRISQKLGWTKNKDKYKIEKDLEKLFPKRYWNSINYIVVSFGQIYGRSRKNEDNLLKKIRTIK